MSCRSCLLTVLLILGLAPSMTAADQWTPSFPERLDLAKHGIAAIAYDGDQVTVRLLRELGNPRVDDQAVALNPEKTYAVRPEAELRFVHRHGSSVFRQSRTDGGQDLFRYEFITVFNASSFGGPETTEVWTLFFRKPTPTPPGDPSPTAGELIVLRMVGIARPTDQALRDICQRKYNIVITSGGCVPMPGDQEARQAAYDKILTKFGKDVVKEEEDLLLKASDGK